MSPPPPRCTTRRCSYRSWLGPGAEPFGSPATAASKYSRCTSMGRGASSSSSAGGGSNTSTASLAGGCRARNASTVSGVGGAMHANSRRCTALRNSPAFANLRASLAARSRVTSANTRSGCGLPTPTRNSSHSPRRKALHLVMMVRCKPRSPEGRRRRSSCGTRRNSLRPPADSGEESMRRIATCMHSVKWSRAQCGTSGTEGQAEGMISSKPRPSSHSHAASGISGGGAPAGSPSPAATPSARAGAPPAPRAAAGGRPPRARPQDRRAVRCAGSKSEAKTLLQPPGRQQRPIPIAASSAMLA